MSMRRESKESGKDKKTPRWDDLESFAIIAKGIRAGQTLQQIGQDPRNPFKSARMLYLRLTRLEHSLGHKLINRRPWKRGSTLTKAGEHLEKATQPFQAMRQKLHHDFNGSATPVLRIATNASALLSIIPKMIEQRTHKKGVAELGFKPEIITLETYAQVAAAIENNQADIGLCYAPPNENILALPRTIRNELLLKSEVLALCAPGHPLAKRYTSKKPWVNISELLHEQIIARAGYETLFSPELFRGGWITVANAGDIHGYVRLGLGVGLNTRLGYEVIYIPEGIIPLPLRPSIYFSWYLVTPKKQLLPDKVTRDFVQELRNFYLTLNTKWANIKAAAR